MLRLAPLLALALAASTAAHAEGLIDMTAAERDAFRAEVRAYLLENPEVLVETMDVLRARDDAAAAARDAELLQSNAPLLFNSPTDWVGGNLEGDITLVEFMDYRCGYCRKAHDEVNELVNSDGNIRYVLKEYPILGEESLLSSQFAISVRRLHGDEAYKAAHDALITLRGAANLPTLERLAGELGFDSAPIMAEMKSPDVQKVIDQNHALANVMQVSGTPTFVVDQTLLRGYVPLEDMRKIVADERAG